MEQDERKSNKSGWKKTNLQDIDTLARDMAENLVLLVEMVTKHLGRLVHCILNLDGNATSCPRFLHDILRFVIDFQGRTGVH